MQKWRDTDVTDGQTDGFSALYSRILQELIDVQLGQQDASVCSEECVEP